MRWRLALGYKYCISEDFEVIMARALLCSRLQLAELERGRPKLSTPERAKIQLNNRRFTVSATQSLQMRSERDDADTEVSRGWRIDVRMGFLKLLV